MWQINQEYRELDRSPAALRRFGLTIGVVLVSLGGLFVWRHRPAGWPMLAFGGLLLLAAASVPTLLKPLHRVWMTLSLALGLVMTCAILTIVFYLVLTPVALLQRLLGKRPLDLAFRSSASSYWEVRPARLLTAADYEKQY